MRPPAQIPGLLILLAPSLAFAQTRLDLGLLQAYTEGHRSLAFGLQLLIGAFIALRLGWRWRRERIEGATHRALIPAAAYTLSACLVVAALWLIASTQSMRAVNALSLASFLLGTASGSLTAFFVHRRVLLTLPAPRPSLDDEIARRLAALAQEREEG